MQSKDKAFIHFFVYYSFLLILILNDWFLTSVVLLQNGIIWFTLPCLIISLPQKLSCLHLPVEAETHEQVWGYKSFFIHYNAIYNAFYRWLPQDYFLRILEKLKVKYILFCYSPSYWSCVSSGVEGGDQSDFNRVLLNRKHLLRLPKRDGKTDTEDTWATQRWLHY